MTLNFKIKVLEDDFIIAQRISYALIPEINKYLNNIYQNMANSISNIVVNSIISQPEYESLMGGQLQGEFGIPDPSSRLSEIISTIKSGSSIVRKPTTVVNGKIKAGIRFQMIQSDFQDLISLGSASFATEKGTKLFFAHILFVNNIFFYYINIGKKTLFLNYENKECYF